MKILKKFMVIISSILGGSAGIILFGIINWVLNLQLSFTVVFLSGLAGGVIFGNLLAFYFARLLIKRAKNADKKSFYTRYNFVR